jgi:hypothetical protein
MCSKITYWQEAAGDNDRNYVDLCLKWGVILNGPGYAGPYPECHEPLKKHGWSSKKISDLKRFSEEMKDGDIVALRIGTKEVHGVGVIVGDYAWNDVFSDVDGWDLQHVRRVKWLWDKNKGDGIKKFPTYSLKQGDPTQKLKPIVIDWIESLNLDYEDKDNLPDLPSEVKEIMTIESIGEFLFGKGTATNSIELLSNVIDDLEMIAKWYSNEKNPSEYETLSYLIIPLLRALGWTPQKMAIEWKNVDIALFNKLPRDDENLIAVVEAKKKDNSCLTAFSQAQRYSDNKPNCNRLIVSDGLRYGVYIKNGDNYELHAYMNLTSFKSEYPIYDCKGIGEALWAMAPEWTPDNKSPSHS